MRFSGRLVCLGALATVAVVAGPTGSASAATFTVDDDGVQCPAPNFATITAAVGAASNGDTINVCAGTYNEGVDISKTLTINGAQSGVDARNPRGAESVWTNSCGPVRVMADNVVIDGFTIEGSTDSDPCYLSGIWTNPGFSGTHGGTKIYNNIVQNNISGLELDNDGTFATEVVHNLFQNNNNPGPGAGNAIQVNFGLSSALIDGNKFSGHTSSSLLVPGVTSNTITFSNNQLVGGTSERVVFGNVSDSTISGNTSNGSTALNGTVRLFGGNSNIAVTGNDLLNGVRGVRVDDPFSIGPNSGVSVTGNNIAGNTAAGLQVDHLAYSDVAALNATCNWWGNASGPTNAGNPGGTGDAVVDPDTVVNYTPWKTAAAPGGPCNGPLSQMQRKELVEDSLLVKKMSASSKDAKEIGEAIKHLDKSRDSSLWVDGNHLDPKKGNKVFDEEKDAVEHLSKVKNTDVSSEIGQLVDIDRKLAKRAIDDAVAAPVMNPKNASKKAKEIDEANKELAKGDTDAGAGKPKDAIEHYKHAWEHAQNAIEAANKP